MEHHGVCAAPNCLNNSKSKVRTFKFPTNSKLRKQWLLKIKEKNLSQTRTLAFVRFILSKTASEKNLAIRRSLISSR